MLKKIMEVVLNILIVLVVIIVLIVGYSFIQTKVMQKDYVNFGGYTAFEVATGSMSGSIEIGDVIIVKLNEEKIKRDDIIVFKQDGYIVTHRVIEVQEDGKTLVTKGDANNAQDEPISKDDVIGKVIKILPNIGIWKKVVQTPKVIISVVITIILFGLAFSIQVVDDKKDTKGQKEENKQISSEREKDEKKEDEKNK
ncbi:MAG: signal peptidase I [Clostridia bacterium]